MSEEQERLTIKQIDAAKAVGVTDRTIRNWEKRGLITGKRQQGVKLYPYAKLKELAGVA